MPRPPRIDIPNAWYHVMNRGSGHKHIFKYEKHAKAFLFYLKEAVTQYSIEVHSFCLMKNHYHLLVRTPEGNLSQAMKKLSGLYTQYYNREMETDGPLFRGRYKAILVEDEIYKVNVSRYIHLNPPAADCNLDPLQYKWSSYRCYVFQDFKPHWLRCDDILKHFGNNTGNYMQFMSAGVDKETAKFYSSDNNSLIYGSKKFTESITEEYLT